MANTNKYYVNLDGKNGSYFENAQEAIDSLGDYQGNVEILSSYAYNKKIKQRGNDGVNLGAIAAGIGCLFAGIGGFIWDAWKERKNNK